MEYRNSHRLETSGSIANIMQKESNIKQTNKKHYGNRLFEGNEIFQADYWINRERRGSVDLNNIKNRSDYAGMRYGQTDEVKMFNETCVL